MVFSTFSQNLKGNFRVSNKKIMKTQNTLLKSLLIVILSFSTLLATGQKKLILESKPDHKISGTSSLHDWDMTSQTATCFATVVFNGKDIVEIKALTVDMDAETLKSGRNGMDKNAYKALKTNVHKKIKFELVSAAENTDGTWNLTGNFTVAGVTQKITVKTKQTTTGNTVGFEGSYAFKLTDYKIPPPTAVMGTIKTGDAVTVSFKLKFK